MNIFLYECPGRPWLEENLFPFFDYLFSTFYFFRLIYFPHKWLFIHLLFSYFFLQQLPSHFSLSTLLWFLTSMQFQQWTRPSRTDTTSSPRHFHLTIPGPPITDSPLDIIQFQPSFFSSNFDMGGSSLELAQNSPTVKKGAPAAASTVETVYLCCESKGEDRYLCDDCER